MEHSGISVKNIEVHTVKKIFKGVDLGFRMCYGENCTVNFFETLADNVFRHSYSMMHI
jgi:hypothetical protein